MKGFYRIFAAGICVIAALFIWGNFMMSGHGRVSSNREYRVEINRAAMVIADSGLDKVKEDDYKYLINIEKYDGSEEFFDTDHDNMIKEINGVMYRFDYEPQINNDTSDTLYLNIILSAVALLYLIFMIYIRNELLKPLANMKDLPYELSKGNLTVSIPESKNKFFGSFTWGLDLLRENIEDQKSRELELHKEKKLLLLSLSHDIKTPLSAIKLYAKALERGLYSDKEKQVEVAENINSKADEIESFVNQIVSASREDFLSINVEAGEAYISDIINDIREYYKEKMDLNKTILEIGEFSDCIIKCDHERSVEVLQNIIENALKYGDGKKITVNFSREEGCLLVAVSNTGSEIISDEIPHIFESFWRGSNSHNVKGSGLGLYICRQIMKKMNGDIFADVKDDLMTVTAVFTII